MKKNLITRAIAVGCLLLTGVAQAFIANKITIEGLQGITTGTVYSYLPVKVGDDITAKKSTQIIDALYKTGFFSNVTLYQKGADTLVVKVAERPIIGNINVSGNNAIKKEDLNKALAKMNVAEGLTYNQSQINQIKVGLQEQYYSMGYYGANVDIVKTDESKNRIALNIKITEGALAIVRDIHFIGNAHFSDDILLDQMDLSTPGLWTWMTDTDRYSREKLQGSLQKIVAYYMDHGYLKVKLDSATVQVTPDKANVYITTHITEGAKYTVSGYGLFGDIDKAVPESEMRKGIELPTGSTFSLKTVTDSEEIIKSMFGRKGYSEAKVEFTPDVNEKDHTVFIRLTITQNNMMYVRHIQFVGNNKTNDAPLRSHMAQVEGGIINTDNLAQSKRQLYQLPYISNIEMKTENVPGTTDQVDVNVKMDEKPSAQVSAGIGYSQVDGMILNGSVVQKNLFGTGKSAKLQAVYSAYQQTVSADYFNPYYTTSGISRGVTAYMTRYDPEAANLSSDYSFDQYGSRMYYNIPMSASVGATDSINLGYGYMGTKLDVYDSASTQVSDFVDDYGKVFNEVQLTAGWTHNGLNRAIFPTEGFYQSLGTDLYLPMESGSIGYYTSKYQNKWYVPLGKQFVIFTRSEAGYGDGLITDNDLPFYSNFYAGGMTTVQGYEGNTLGPLDSNGSPYGGNFLLDGAVSLIFPNFISPDNLRTSLFFDAGQVYDLEGATEDSGFSTADLRYSAGLDVQWLSPLGILEFSLAKALNPSDTDHTEFFNFNIGASF
ncbi:MAG: outer membrane protein assembly factor BamA [Pseudomonadota bacterium]